jgi:hypothetical protein
LRKPTLGNCFGIALAHSAIAVATFFLLESMLNVFRRGVRWEEIALTLAVLGVSFAALVMIVRTILMTDYHRATIFSASYYALMVPLSAIAAGAWWFLR